MTQEPTLNQSSDVAIKNEKPTKVGIRDLFIGGFRLIILGIAIYLIVDLLLIKYLSLLYPYLTPELLTGLRVFAVVGYMIPGALFIASCPWGSALEPPQTQKLPLIVKIMLILGSICAIGGLLGIRNGIKILLAFHDSSKIKAEESTPTVDPGEAMRSYRLYLAAGGTYLLAFGLVFLALIEFLLVITIDLMYPDLTVQLLIILQVWFWVCFIGSAGILLTLSVWLRLNQSATARKVQNTLVVVGAVLSMLSVFGLSVGFTVLKNREILTIN